MSRSTPARASRRTTTSTITSTGSRSRSWRSGVACRCAPAGRLRPARLGDARGQRAGRRARRRCRHGSCGRRELPGRKRCCRGALARCTCWRSTASRAWSISSVTRGEGRSPAGARLARRGSRSRVRGPREEPAAARLSPTIADCSLTREPFARLIEANRMDQRVSRYRDVGGAAGLLRAVGRPGRRARTDGVRRRRLPSESRYSDSICTALQLIEHSQDVAEDLRAGRVYLPAEDLRRFGCTIGELVRCARRRAAAPRDRLRGA